MRILILATRNPGKVREFQTLLGPLGYNVITAAEAGYHDEPEETGTTFRANAEIKARAVYEGTGGKYPVLSDDSGLAVDALGGAPGVWSARYAGPGCTDEDNNKKLVRELDAVTSTIVNTDLASRSVTGSGRRPENFQNDPSRPVPEQEDTLRRLIVEGRTARYQISLCLLQPVPEQEDGLRRLNVDASTLRQAQGSPGSATAPVFFDGTCEGLIGFEERGGGGFGYDVLFIPTGKDGKPLDGRTFAEMSAAEKHPLSHRGKAVTELIAYLRTR